MSKIIVDSEYIIMTKDEAYTEKCRVVHSCPDGRAGFKVQQVYINPTGGTVGVRTTK